MNNCGQCAKSLKAIGHSCMKHAPCFLETSFLFSPSQCIDCQNKAEKAKNGDKEALKQWRTWLGTIKNRRKFGRKLPLAEAVKLWVSANVEDCVP